MSEMTSAAVLGLVTIPRAWTMLMTSTFPLAAAAKSGMAGSVASELTRVAKS